jgi:hypothetical protein
MLNLPSAASTGENETESNQSDREQPRARSVETGVSGGEVEEEKKALRGGVEGERGELAGRSGLGRAGVAMSSAVRHDSL